MLKNQKNGNKVELLSPTSSFESIMAAIQGGADSIYFGVEQLNMRARSSNNFMLNDIAVISTVCKKKGLKSYLTLNTIIYDHDLTLMRSILDKAKENGIDAVIAMDHSVIDYANSIDIPVHISTQANICNIEALRFYAHYSDTVILARELTLDQVGSICEAIEREKIIGSSGELIKIEIFVHGALCMAVSGKCYLSLHSYRTSANRGACRQNCRRTYTVTDNEGNSLEIDNEYIMSPKDLSTIGFLDKIIRSGVQILKIEGRGRSPEYVKGVTSCYREAIDACINGTYSSKKINHWEGRLATIYNRGFWDGYYLGKRLGEWTDADGSKATKKKIYIGSGIKYFKKARIGEFQLEANELKVDDEILITGQTTGVIQTFVKNLRIDNDDVNKVKKGDRFTMPVESVIRSSDKLYKLKTGFEKSVKIKKMS